MKKAIALVMVLVLLLSMTACTQISKPAETPEAKAPESTSSDQAGDTKDAEIVFKVGSGGSETLPMYIALKEVFKPMVEEKSNGRIKVELYPASQLGDDVKLIEQLRSGTLEASIPVTSPLVGLCPEMSIFDLPFLFASPEIADKVLDGKIGERMNSVLDEKGLVNLAWGELGFRNVTNSKKDIKTVEDLKGLKLRTMENQIHIAMWKSLGVNATPMPISEVFTAIQQGAIDGQENPVSAFYGWKIHEVNKHITLTGHVYSPSTFIVSKKIFDTYDKETQDIIMEAGKATCLRSREISRAQEADLLKEMIDSGCTVTELTESEKAPFQKATESAWDLVEKEVGPDLIAELKAEVAKAAGN
jgi:tripartite ATP-independent transporter DctP family solute receptor